MFPQFMELLPELKIQVIRKCLPVEYVRLRQTCRFMDNFCEQNRNRLGIYCYQKKPQLFLLNSLDFPPFNRGTASPENLDGFHVIINYGKKCGDRLSIPMKPENVAMIRRSLSGFAFPDVEIMNRAEGTHGKALDEILQYFLEATADLNVKSLKLEDLTLRQIQILISRWKVEQVIVHRHGEGQSILEIDQLKKLKHVAFACFPSLERKIIEETAVNRETAFLCIWNLPAAVAWSAMKNIMEKWENRQQKSRFELSFGEAADYMQSELINKEDRNYLRQPEGAVHLGCFKKSRIINFAAEVPGRGRILRNWPVKTDVWLSQLPSEGEDKWQFVTLRRVGHTNFTEVSLAGRTPLTTDGFILELLKILQSLYPGSYLDCSTFYEKLKKSTTENLERIKEEFSGIVQSVEMFSRVQERFEDLY